MLRWPMLALFFVTIVPGILQARNAVELDGAWRIIPSGKMDDPDDSQWPSVQLPGNVAKELRANNGVLWLRRDLNAEPGRYNLSFLSGTVFDRLDVYINGIRIGGGPESPGRPVIVTIPGSIMKPGINYIALRIESKRPLSAGILQGPLLVDQTSNARELFWKTQISGFVFALLFLSSSVFFILLHFRVEAGRIYLPSGLAYGALAIHFLCENEIVHWVVQLHGFLELTSTVTGILVPVLFYPFIIRFFQMEAPRGYRILWWSVIGIAFVAALLYALKMLALLEILEFSWKVLNCALFFYAGYLSFRKIAENVSLGSLLIGLGFIVFFIHGLVSLIQKQLWTSGAVDTDLFSVIGLLLPAAIVIYQLIALQRDVDIGSLKMESVNELRTRIFHHIHLAIAQPVLELSDQLRSKMETGFSRKEASAVQFHIKDLETSLDDVLELSRLEVMEEPEARVPVNVGDFLSAVLPTSGVTCTVKVHPELMLESSLELVHSAVIRLVDFPGFKTFRHIDLIVTSDLEQRLHFRFLLQHDDRKTMKRMQRILTGKLPDLEGLWIQWGIIQEIIRILDGTLEVRILNRKFLCIDARLEAFLSAEQAMAGATRGLHIVSLAEPEREAEAVAKAVSEERRPDIKFHGNMSTGEFIAWVKSKIRRSA